MGNYKKIDNILMIIAFCLIRVFITDNKTIALSNTENNEAIINVNAHSKITDYYIAVVGNLNKIERLDRKKVGNLYPWEIARGFDFDTACMNKCTEKGPACWHRCAREPVSNQGAIVVVSNSCGFMRTEFTSVLLAPTTGKTLDFTQVAPFSIYQKLGEFCRLTNLILSERDGVLLAKWGDSFYDLFIFKTFKDSSGTYYMSPFSISKKDRAKVEDMLVPLDVNVDSCLYVGSVPYETYEDMKSSKYTRPDPNRQYDLCVTHGVPIAKVLSVYKRIYPY